MIVPFVGGPYDGMELNPILIEKLNTSVSIQTQQGPRVFVLLPHLGDWPAVLKSNLSVGESRGFYYYELANTLSGPKYQFDPGGARFQRAVLESN